jgi:hypothetical protein
MGAVIDFEQGCRRVRAAKIARLRKMYRREMDNAEALDEAELYNQSNQCRQRAYDIENQIDRITWR